MKKKIVVLTGAGISAESGIKTFRDAGGLWEGHDVMEVASPQGWNKNKALVLDFYNQRRRQLHEVAPNAAHKALVELEKKYDVHVVTQNIDDLHERAGSSKIIHLHGELFKARSLGNENLIYEWKKDIVLGDKCEEGHQLRPHIVWFGEMVPMLEVAAETITTAEVVLVVGTSMQVYPAAGLVGYAPPYAPVFYVDPKPSLNYELERAKHLTTIAEVATKGVRKVVDELLAKE
ncbi:MAG: NAD-dependent deacylase [Bacteroidota bacterium]